MLRVKPWATLFGFRKNKIVWVNVVRSQTMILCVLSTTHTQMSQEKKVILIAALTKNRSYRTRSFTITNNFL